MSIAVMLWTSSAQQAWISVLLYVGPDLLLPLTSALAAVAGVLLLFWQKVVALVRAVWRLVSRK